MLLLGALSVLLWGSGAWLSLNTPSHPRLNEDSRVHGWILLGFFVLLMVWFGAIIQVFGGVFAQLAATLLLGVTGACWTMYFSTMGGHFFCVVIPRWWLGDRKIRLIVSFDLGDAAMKAGDPARAANLYRLELDKHPDNPDLYLRLADAYRVLKDPSQVAANLRHAARCARDVEQRGSVSILLAEELGKSGDPGGAQTVLQTLLRDPGLAKFHPAAKGRLQRPWN